MASEYEVLTLKELSEMLHIHPDTLYKLIRKGEIPGFRIGNEWRFRTDLLETWMAEQMLRNLRALSVAPQNLIRANGAQRAAPDGSRHP